MLPEHGIPHELLSVDTEDVDENYLTSRDLRPQNEDDIVYNQGTQMSSFLPIPECHQQEIQALRAHLVQPPSHMSWPTVENKPIN